MEMVGHQDIGVDGAALRRCRFPEPAEEQAAPLIIEEHRLAIVSALKDMMGLPRHGQSRQPRHAGSLNVSVRLSPRVTDRQ